MPVTISSIGPVQRLKVSGDPSVAGSVPGVANEGDVIVDEDTGLVYSVVKGGGAVVGGSTLGKAAALANGWA